MSVADSARRRQVEVGQRTAECDELRIGRGVHDLHGDLSDRHRGGRDARPRHGRRLRGALAGADVEARLRAALDQAPIEELRVRLEHGRRAHVEAPRRLAHRGQAIARGIQPAADVAGRAGPPAGHRASVRAEPNCTPRVLHLLHLYWTQCGRHPLEPQRSERTVFMGFPAIWMNGRITDVADGARVDLRSWPALRRRRVRGHPVLRRPLVPRRRAPGAPRAIGGGHRARAPLLARRSARRGRGRGRRARARRTAICDWW